MENKDYIITYMGKCYAIDLDALKKVCLISDNQKGKETEITENYTMGENGELELSEKLTREVRGNGNPQNDMIIYDVVKSLILSLLENKFVFEEDELTMDFSSALAFNTCIRFGILIEVE